ncbi:hypothetical protein L7F22_025988 [Adiantum nelumboides]|nr:hypothetical protein [Adiantum nelumboides]
MSDQRNDNNGLFPQAPPDNTNLHYYAFNSKVMVAAIIILFFVILFILLLHVYAKWFWHSSSATSVFIRRGIGASARSAVQPTDVHRGLDAATIAQLPNFVYKTPAVSAVESFEAGKDESTMPLLECAVCLSEFQENEKGRLLPSCKHTFHTECIDMWFFSHSTCPLCRTEVLLASAASLKDEQHQGEEQEAVSPPHDTGGNNNASANAAQLPCNVLFWGNEAQVTSTQESSSASSTPPRLQALPQITIDIPPIEGAIMLTITTPGRRLSSKSACCQGDQAACSSQQQALKSPGLRASLKRILSRQSSRHGEGNEGSPK